VNFIYFLKLLWRRRLAVVFVGFISVVISALAVYNVSVSPPGIGKRVHLEAKGSIEILVDSEQSAIGDIGRNLEPLTARAGVFARYIAGGNVVKRISESTGIPVNRIEVAGPAPLPGEAIGTTSPPLNIRPYGIEIVQHDDLPIVSFGTRAPTVDEARALAAAAPPAIRGIVDEIQNEQHVPDSKRVAFRVLGPAQADLTNEALGIKAAVAIFLVLFGLGLLLIVGLPRLIEAWRSVELDPPTAGDQLEVLAKVPPGMPSDPTVPPALEPAETVAERAQLEMRRSGDV
jgi:hypothetical protein